MIVSLSRYLLLGLTLASATFASAFDAHVTANQVGDAWTYTLHNDESPLSTKRPHSLFVTLDINADLTDITSPPGWDFETDHQTYIVWVFLENQPISVTPAAGQSLSGFGFTSAGSKAITMPISGGCYESTGMTEAEDFFGASDGPVYAPGGVVSGNLVLDSFDQHGSVYPAPFEFRDPNTDELIALRLGFIAPDGTFGVKAPTTPGTYRMSTKSRSFLRKAWEVTTSPAGVTGMTGTALNGDVDDDNEISIGDYAILSQSYGSIPGDPFWSENADLNADEAIDIGDYAILSANYGQVGD